MKTLIVHLIADCKYLPYDNYNTNNNTGNGTDIDTESYVTSIDSVLRSIIILDPLESSNIIRNEFELFLLQQNQEQGQETTTSTNTSASRVNQVISGLLDHCEMMAQFNKV